MVAEVFSVAQNFISFLAGEANVNYKYVTLKRDATGRWTYTVDLVTVTLCFD